MIVSDAGGGFRFTGLPAGKYTLRATRPGVSTSSLWQSVGAVVSAGDLAVNLVLPDAGMLTGKVAFSEGGAPRMFTVAVGAGYPAAFAEKDGSFSIDAPGGKQTLFISGPDFMRAVHAVDVAEKQSTDVGTITVERGRSVAGRVVDQNGNAVEGATVVAGMMLSGSGAELNIESESYGSQQTTTDAAGRFLMTGFGEAPLVAVAQHADVGRSESVSILRSSRSAQVELVLVATGALKGVVRRDGKPLPGTVVIANPRAATRSNFFVVTGEDGSYALDKLAAGDYYVMAMIGGGGPKPKDMHFRAVDVAVGEIAERDIDIDVGDVTVAVTTTTDTGAPVMLAIVFVMTGTWDAPTSEALRNTFAEVETATVYLRNAMGPGAIDVAGLQPGPHTTCVTPIPADPSDMDAIQQAMQRADQLPMTCAQFAVTAAPTQQSVAVTVPTEWTKP